MPGKAKTGSTTTAGPTWEDILVMWRAVESTHSCTLALSVRTDGYTYGGSADVELRATRPILISPGRAYSLSLRFLWPGVRHKTFEGALYAALLRMDYRLGAESYEQAPLPGFPPPE